MINLFENQGMKYYKQFNDFDNSLLTINLNELVSGSKRLYELGSPPKIRLALILAKIHKYLGNNEKAREFVYWGLNNTRNATTLNKEFSMIIQEVGDFI